CASSRQCCTAIRTVGCSQARAVGSDCRAADSRGSRHLVEQSGRAGCLVHRTRRLRFLRLTPVGRHVLRATPSRARPGWAPIIRPRSEVRFRTLTELSSDWFWEQDENLRFTYLSDRANDLSGYSGASSIGKTRWELENMTPVSTSWLEHKAVLEARQPFRDLELRRVGPDGVVRYLSVSGAPIFDEHGRFKGYQGVGRDITERKRVEDELN